MYSFSTTVLNLNHRKYPPSDLTLQLWLNCSIQAVKIVLYLMKIIIFQSTTQLAKRADIGQKRISSLVRYLPSAVRMSVSSRLLPPSILLRTKTIPFCPTIGTEFVRYLPLILFCPTSGTEFVRYLPSFVLLSVSARLLPPSILRRTIWHLIFSEKILLVITCR